MTVLNKTPRQTQNILNKLCALNAQHQDIDWLRLAKKTQDSWYIIQRDSTTTLIQYDGQWLLTLVCDSLDPPPRDAIYPAVDAPSWVAQYIDNIGLPNYLLYASDIDQEWQPIWLATTWWPHADITDSVDAPEKWVSWWWHDIMQSENPTPDLSSF